MYHPSFVFQNRNDKASKPITEHLRHTQYTFNTSNYRITEELTSMAQEAKRDCDTSHITWKSDLDIMPLKGKSSRGLISLSEVHHGTCAPPNSQFTPQVCPLLGLGKASPLSAMPPHLKISGQCHRRKSRNPIEYSCARNW
ncbi:hypothetical protein CEXT_123141 [Caerostris extrusa]|uniref:Uncharacterized protein n=1 Tax=Caerostris extrusa TaxID=172846 RepID=A0AAV4XY25_CAEEX|nr:hypothetical protein CEXT_123141 [Caerostris extrusa]